MTDGYDAFCKSVEQFFPAGFTLRDEANAMVAYAFRNGPSSGGSRLNRTALKYCLAVLEELVPVIQSIVMERAANDDWPDLCYPPMV